MTQQTLFPKDRQQRKRRSYHVRSHQTVPEVQAGEAKAKNQDATILDWFVAHPEARVTPWSLLDALGGTMLITSVRRSLTNLTDVGLLRRHDEDRRQERAGAKNATWSLAEL